jgi:hypothetical protein
MIMSMLCLFVCHQQKPEEEHSHGSVGEVREESRSMQEVHRDRVQADSEEIQFHLR